MEETYYHPRDALSNTATTALQLGFGGAMIAGVRNALTKQNVGAMGIFTRSGGLIATYAGVGATYQFTLDATCNLRQKHDTYSEAIAGFAAGTALGISRGSLPFMVGAGVSMGAILGAYHYTQGVKGAKVLDEAQEQEEVERREALKKLRRRPLSETLEQLGEGRGIYGPGYEERRRQRLLEKYGIDVKAAQEAA